MEQIYSTGEVSRMVGVQPYQLTYAIAIGKLPEPKYRFLDKRCFTAEDIRRVAEHFRIEVTGAAAQEGGRWNSSTTF
jgi:DNA-binding transcriptional MerR regulator